MPVCTNIGNTGNRFTSFTRTDVGRCWRYPLHLRRLGDVAATALDRRFEPAGDLTDDHDPVRGIEPYPVAPPALAAESNEVAAAYPLIAGPLFGLPHVGRVHEHCHTTHNDHGTVWFGLSACGRISSCGCHLAVEWTPVSKTVIVAGVVSAVALLLLVLACGGQSGAPGPGSSVSPPARGPNIPVM